MCVHVCIMCMQNGLMWRRNESGAVEYHMFFQSGNPGQGHPSEWGHTVSPDLVNSTDSLCRRT